MDNHQAAIYERLAARYATGEVPWDDASPPPEVINFVATLPPGRALDLGCGYGRASIYLARQGWDVDGIDFIQQALDVAKVRANEAGVEVRFHLSTVTDLDFLEGPFDFALDVGCAHNLDEAGLNRYRDEIRRLLRSGGHFLLFARLWESPMGPEKNGPSGIEETVIRQSFSSDFTLRWLEKGQTGVEDKPAWPSAWFLFRRL